MWVPRTGHRRQSPNHVRRQGKEKKEAQQEECERAKERERERGGGPAQSAPQSEECVRTEQRAQPFEEEGNVPRGVARRGQHCAGHPEQIDRPTIREPHVQLYPVRIRLKVVIGSNKRQDRRDRPVCLGFGSRRFATPAPQKKTSKKATA